MNKYVIYVMSLNTIRSTETWVLTNDYIELEASASKSLQNTAKKINKKSITESLRL